MRDSLKDNIMKRKQSRMGVKTSEMQITHIGGMPVVEGPVISYCTERTLRESDVQALHKGIRLT